MHCSSLIIHYSHGHLPISIYTKWWQQSIWGHTSYLSDSPTASRLWLCSSLHLAQTEPTWKWRSGTRLAIYNSKEMKKVLVQMFNWAWVQLAWLDFLPWAISCWPLVSSHLTHLPLDKMAAILADDNFKCIFFNENDGILIQILLKFVPKSSIDNKPSLVQVMAWRRPGDKPLSEPMMVRLPTHICITRPQWGKQCGRDSWGFQLLEWSLKFNYADVIPWKCFRITGPLWGESTWKGPVMQILLLALTSYGTNCRYVGNLKHHKADISLYRWVYEWSLGYAGIILWMCPANERWRYNVLPSLIGWVHTQNDSWIWVNEPDESKLG